MPQIKYFERTSGLFQLGGLVSLSCPSRISCAVATCRLLARSAARWRGVRHSGGSGGGVVVVATASD